MATAIAAAVRIFERAFDLHRFTGGLTPAPPTLI